MDLLDDINVDHWYTILNFLPNPVTLNKKSVNEDGRTYDEITFVNKAFIDTIGYTVEDIPADIVWFEKAYPDAEYQNYVIEEWNKLVENANKENSNLLGFPANITCKDNVKRWFQVTTNLDYPIFDEYHLIVFVEIETPENIVLELQDVTKNLQSQNEKLYDNKQKLQKQYSLINTILDTVPVRIFWKDMDGVYLGANKRFVEDTQLNDVSEMIGKTDYDMPWKKDAERFREDDASVIRSEVPRLLYEEEQPKEDGSCIYLVTSKVPLRDMENNIIGILGVYNDITEHKLLQKEAKEKDAQLLQQSRLAQMGEMISMIAHQWRQPLSAISATAINIQLDVDLEKLKLEDKDKEYLLDQIHDIYKYTKNLSTTIDDFRNFYKPNKKLDYIQLDQVSSKALAIIKSLLINNNIQIIEDYCCSSKLEMFTNEIVQVVLNILKNANDNFMERNIKEPTIKITTNDKVLSICDNGGGIPEEVIDKIFDPYFSTKDEKNGTGLGLYMSKTIVEEHHNATLEVENTDDGVCLKIDFN